MTVQPKGLTPIVAEITGTKQQIFNWNGYGVIVGAGHSASILDDIEHKRKKVKQNMIIVVGNPGEGKSYFALRLAQIFDQYFNPEIQIVFDRLHLLNLIGFDSPLKMGQVILIDEAQFIAGARHWYDDVQKDVMDHLEAIRSKGFIIIIVALNIQLLDKILRKFVLNKMIEMKERGFGRVYHLWTPQFSNKAFPYRRTMGDMSLQLPDVEKCAYANCLICKHLYGYKNNPRVCMTLRARYERMKKAFLDVMSKQSAQKVEKHERTKNMISDKKAFNFILENQNKLTYNKKGNVEPVSIKILLEDIGVILPKTRIRSIAKEGMIRHPTVFKKKGNGINE